MPAAAERPSMPASLSGPLARPPERLAAGALVLRRVEATDAAAIAVAVGASLDHLRPWMPWATPEAADLRTQRVRVAGADGRWKSGGGFIYVTTAGDSGRGAPWGGAASRGDRDGEFVGTMGLPRRAADDAVEIGYWIASAKTRRGYATAAARAVTAVARELAHPPPDGRHSPKADTASAALPRP